MTNQGQVIQADHPMSLREHLMSSFILKPCFYNTIFVLFWSNALALHREVLDYCVSSLSEGTESAASPANLRLCGGRRSLRLSYYQTHPETWSTKALICLPLLFCTRHLKLISVWHRGIRLVWTRLLYQSQLCHTLHNPYKENQERETNRHIRYRPYICHLSLWGICIWHCGSQTVNKQKSLRVHLKSLFSIN